MAVAPPEVSRTGTLSDAQIWQYASGAGFSGDQDAITMTAICLAESGGQIDPPLRRNVDGSYDYGLCQINSVHKEFDYNRLRTDPAYNFMAAHVLYGRRGNFHDWSAYNNGSYLLFMPRAKTAGKSHGTWVVPLPSSPGAVGNPDRGAPLGPGDPLVPDPVNRAADAATSGWGSVTAFLAKLTNGAMWKRAGLIALGLFVLILGFVLMLGSDKSVRGAASKVALA